MPNFCKLRQIFYQIAYGWVPVKCSAQEPLKTFKTLSYKQSSIKYSLQSWSLAAAATK